MLKKCILLIVALIISGFVGLAPASAILIDFETYASGAPTYHLAPVGTEFLDWGISRISSENDSGSTVDAVIRQDVLPWLNYASPISALAPWVGSVSGTGYGPAQAPIMVSFVTPIDYFSVYAMDVGFNGLKAEAYGSDSSLISSVSIDGTGRTHDGPSNNDFIEFNFVGISMTMIKFSQILGPDWDLANGLGKEGYLLDDMSFTPTTSTSPIPEPATLLLLGTGLLSMAGVGIRRKLRQ